MGRTLKDVMDGLEPGRRARIGAHAEKIHQEYLTLKKLRSCLLYTSPSPRDKSSSRMPSSA